MAKILAPHTVEIRNFKNFTVSETNNKLSGNIFFGSKKVLSFTGETDNLLNEQFTILDATLAEKMVSYQEANETSPLNHTLSDFMLSAVEFHLIKQKVSKAISKFKKENQLYSRLMIGAYVFVGSLDESNPLDVAITVFEGLPFENADGSFESLEDAVKYEGLYENYKDVYFMNYASESSLNIQKLK